MSKGKGKRKNRNEDCVSKIVLITVFIQLISAIVNLIDKLIE